jgi:hypothetical protein
LHSKFEKRCPHHEHCCGEDPGMKYSVKIALMEPSECTMPIYRKKNHSSPHRNIGQVFRSRSFLALNIITNNR